MKNWKNKSASRKGFTLVELLIVIAIIGILASVVTVSMSGARNSAKRASALTTAASALPELVTCQDDGGFGIDTVAPTTTVYLCCNVASSSVAACNGVAEARPGHTAKWPNISSTGWSFGIPTGTLAAGTYEYTLTDGTETITCSYAGNECTVSP